MSKFDRYYDFRKASLNDVDDIMKFIKEEWGKNHILAHERELFVWQYGREEYGDDGLNMILMHTKDGNLVGIMGYISYANDKERLFISPAITKVKNEGLLPLSGMELMKRQKQLVGEVGQFAHGANPKTILPLLEKVFKHEVGLMQHFYMLNPVVKDYRVAKVNSPKYLKYEEKDYCLVEITNFPEVHEWKELETDFPHMAYKSGKFIEKRYFKHPVYQYKIWFIKNEDREICGLLIGREIEQNARKILRIVDFRGDLHTLEKIGKPLNELLLKNGYEYIDLMAWPLPVDAMKRAGFLLLDENGDNIIPNYFEPFICENIRDYCHRTGDYVIFKADGDQDRPNIKRENGVVLYGDNFKRTKW